MLIISYIVLHQIEKTFNWYGTSKVFFQKNLNVKKEVTTKKNGNDLLNSWSLLRGKINSCWSANPRRNSWINFDTTSYGLKEE